MTTDRIRCGSNAVYEKERSHAPPAPGITRIFLELPFSWKCSVQLPNSNNKMTGTRGC